MRSSLIRFSVLALLMSVVLQSTLAASINYGDFTAPSSTVKFLQVTESSGTDPVPLYGPPIPFTVGLDFNPTSFVSSATGGASDITDGQLNFTITGAAVKSLNFSERGDYTLIGTGTTATSAFAGLAVFATVKEIDGVPVAPINLAPVNASVGFNLIANPGVAQPWSLGLGLNIDAQLSQLGYHPTTGATKVDVVLNNTLATISETGSIAFIAKKDFKVTGDTGNIPEPLSLGFVAVGGLLMLRRSRKA